MEGGGAHYLNSRMFSQELMMSQVLGQITVLVVLCIVLQQSFAFFLLFALG